MICRPSIVLLAALLLALPLLADEAVDGRNLERLLAAYDRQGGGNTIPIEKEIIALGATGEPNALVRHLDHPRFGPIVAWALADQANPRTARSIALMAGTWPPRAQGMALTALGRLNDPDSLALLERFHADASFPGWARPAVEGALLRRDHEGTRARVRKELEAKDPETVGAALRVIAETHDPMWLRRLARLVEDERVLPKPVASRFKVTTRVDDGQGNVQFTSTRPSLETVGALALEAANRVVQPDTPEMIAWWYELEQGPRFGRGADGVAFLRRWVQYDTKARSMDLPSATEAVEAFLQAVRREQPKAKRLQLDELGLVRKGWVLVATVDGDVVKASVGLGGTVEFD